MRVTLLLPPCYAPCSGQSLAEEGRLAGVTVRLAAWSGGKPDGSPAIRELNASLRAALAERADLWITGCGHEIPPGSLAALWRAAHGDPMILALAPRSNAGPIAAFPHPGVPGQQKGPDPRAALAAHFPPVSYVPSLSASSVWLKTAFLRDIGLLDEDWPSWTGAIDELVARVNRYGRRAVLANHAYVRRRASCAADEADEARTRQAVQIRLEERYPESAPALARYLHSPERESERLFAPFTRAGTGTGGVDTSMDKSAGKPGITLELSNLSLERNGTTEVCVALARAAASVWTEYDLSVMASAEVWEAYGLDGIPGARRVDVADDAPKTAMALRIGQPWSGGDLRRLFRLAPVVGVFVLDAIAYDCHYIATKIHDFATIWNFTFAFSDIVIAQSSFTMQRLRERFIFGDHCLPFVSRHSLFPDDYAADHVFRRAPGTYLLVVGNAYYHKFVAETIAALAPAMPDKAFIAIGGDDAPYPNVQTRASGALSDEEFSSLYRDAACVIYPSTYEGFGFPILHSLARRKVIYARESALNHELSSLVPHSQNIRLYANNNELLSMLRSMSNDFTHAEGAVTQHDIGWRRSAEEIRDALAGRLRTVDYGRVTQRLRWLNALFA